MAVFRFNFEPPPVATHYPSYMFVRYAFMAIDEADKAIPAMLGGITELDEFVGIHNHSFPRHS
jgi:hypothetical protein